MIKCAIVVPCYKSELTQNELVSLIQCDKVLNEYDRFFVMPKGITIPHGFEGWKTKYFDEAFFSSVSTYNRLMLSAAFYDEFLDYNYILVYQLDAFVFENRLMSFCEMKYDYIGAPWPVGFCYHTKEKSKVLYVGNGGLSLRNTGAIKKWITNNIDYIHKCLDEYGWNEDVVISFSDDMNIAPVDVAKTFSIENGYATTYEIITKNMPFGSHGLLRYDFKLAQRIYALYGYEVEPVDNPFAKVDLKLLQEENTIFEDSFFDNNIAEIFGMAFPGFNKEVIIWGAGNIGEKICWIMKRNGMKIECVLDSSLRKEEIDGIKIVNPLEYLRLNKSKNVIVAFKHNDEAIAFLNDIPNSQEIRYRTYSEIYEYAYQLYLQRRKQ